MCGIELLNSNIFESGSKGHFYHKTEGIDRVLSGGHHWVDRCSINDR